MKTIIITLKNSAGTIEIDDDDDSDVQSYAENLAKILDNNNVTILHTTAGSIILRPNEVTTISVFDSDEDEEDDEIPFDETSSTLIQTQDVEETEDTPEIHEDIITD